MLKIAVCDDERILRKALVQTIDLELSFHGIPCEISEFDSGENLLAVPTSGCDILFLDIEMSHINGMDTARVLRERKEQMIIIFVTSYPDYVFQGYEVKALNYILKPYKEEKIIGVLHQALGELKALKEQYYLIEQKSGSMKLPFSELVCFYSEGRKVNAVTAKERYAFYHKLDDLEKELPDLFVRIHNRYLVNINYVSELRASVVVCGGDELPVSRSYRQNAAIAFAKKILR